MKVFVVRHGESLNNLKGLWTGWADVPLTEKGIEDAKKAGNFLADFSFDKVYASDLERAIETAKNAIPGCPPETSELLREINVGNIANKPLDILTDADRKAIKESGYSIFGGETKEEFQNRVLKFRKELEEIDCETVAVFAHAGWLRTFLDLVTDTYLSRQSIYCGNCAVGVFEFSGGRWRLHSWINLFN